MVKDEKRAEERDPGEHEQNVAVKKGLTDPPKPVVEGETAVEVPGQNTGLPPGGDVPPGKCPMCGRDKVNS